MSYSSFLIVMSQLATKRKARVVMEGEVVFFELSEKKHHCTLYTKVFSGNGYLPNSVRSCVSSSGLLRWQQSGAYLKLDPITSSVYLFQEVQMEEGKYIPFRRHLNDFSYVACQWREILFDFAQKECVSCY